MSARARTVAAAAALACALAPAAGATPSYQVPIGARAIGMGGAFTSLADDATALFWNPAGLARIGHQEVAASHANLFKSGVRDNVGSFVLPLSPDNAVALDWYHSGFDDGELGFGENRVTLGWAMKVSPGLWAGVGGKLLTRATDLDGATLGSARGFGVDAGVLVAPTERWRIGLVAQDLANTRVRENEGGSETAYPRNLRLGASYAWSRWGTAAFDVDDRWHLGLEATPLEALAVRAGVEDDREGPESPTLTFGLGLHAGLLRVDWARTQPPTLDPTDHFAIAMEFNFNPAQVRLEKVQVRDLYTSLYKSYSREPLGTVQVRNLQDRPLTTRVSVFVPELMSAPSEQEVVLRPRVTQEVPLTAVFDERVLAQRGDQPVQVQVGASYQSRRLVRREMASARTVAYAPGAIDWSAGMAQAAAFVTPRDPAVDELARQASRIAALRDDRAFGSRNVAFAAAMTDALAQLGLAYVPDPANPFAATSETPHAVDTIHYPFQTLERLSGDCDDTTVLLASLLGNVGVATRFVDAPGHIFLLVDTGLHPRNRAALGVDSALTVVADEQLWLPLETTAVGKGFAEAWRMGAEEIASWSSRGQIGYVDVTDAQSRYEPVLPPGERRARVLDEVKFGERLAAQAATVSKMRDEYFAAHYGGAARDLEASADALNELARVFLDGGDLTGARGQREEALRKAPQSVTVHNNLGVVLAALDSLPLAEDHWRTALALGARDAGIRINLGLARLARGDSAEASGLLARGLADAGGYEAACRLAGLSNSDSLDRASGPGGDDGLRARLRAAFRRAQAQGVPARGPALPPGRAARGPGAVEGQLGTGVPGMYRYMYWAER